MTALAYATELKLASGWNNTAGYSPITALLDSDSIPMILPSPFEGFTLGPRKARLSRRTYDISSPFQAWTFDGVSIRQLYLLRENYEQMNEGKVTVRIPYIDGSFDDYNAQITVPNGWETMKNSKTGNGLFTPGSYRANWLDNVVIGFNLIETASA
jgi:hypothetical protein